MFDVQEIWDIWQDRSNILQQALLSAEGVIKTWPPWFPFQICSLALRRELCTKGREPTRVRLIKWVTNNKICLFPVSIYGLHRFLKMCPLSYTWLPMKRKDKMIFSLVFLKEEKNPRLFKKIVDNMFLQFISMCTCFPLVNRFVGFGCALWLLRR